VSKVRSGAGFDEVPSLLGLGAETASHLEGGIFGKVSAFFLLRRGRESKLDKGLWKKNGRNIGKKFAYIQYAEECIFWEAAKPARTDGAQGRGPVEQVSHFTPERGRGGWRGRDWGAGERVVSLPFDDAAAQSYGEIRYGLEIRGETIGPNDLKIAAICISNGLTLVSGNISKFGRIAGLAVEDWTRA